MKIIGGGILLTMDENSKIINDGAVAINGEVIEEVGTTANLRKKFPDAEFIDAKGGVIMPGIINAHTHIYSAFARGMSMKNSPVSHTFGEVLENWWWRQDKALTLEDCKYSAYMTLIEGIRYGVTTVFDHHASFGAIRGSLAAIEGAAKELGVRTSLCYEISDRLGDKALQDSIDENIEFARHAKSLNSNMLKGMIGFHASFTVPDKALEQCVKAEADLGCGIHFHVAEGPEDVRHSIRTYGKRIINRLADFNMLNKKSLLIHCVHVSNQEIDFIKAADSMVVHNVESNMGNAVGVSPIIKMMEKGILLGMGTDAYTQDVLESYKVTPILQKLHYSDTAVGFTLGADMLFRNNRQIVKRIFGCDTGMLKKGCQADVITLDYVPHTPLNEGNQYGHIQFGMTGYMVNNTIINGKTVMKDRVIEGIDEAAIRAKSRELAGAMWARA